MVENVKELLDTREEWWLDGEQGVLYHFPNTTLDSSRSGSSSKETAPLLGGVRQGLSMLRPCWTH